jgi:hypothetical protein
MESSMKGLRVQVYRPADGTDCTNGGISSVSAGATSLIVVGITYPALPGSPVQPLPAYYQHAEPSDDAPAVWLAIRDNPRSNGRQVHVQPAMPSPAGCTSWMAGGNYAGSMDSRWTTLTHGQQVVGIHDRTEQFS